MIENSSPVIIRTMNLNDIEKCMLLSQAEGWNQSENDWKRLADNPNNSCFVAEHDHLIIGTATAINYANQIAWIGMMLVHKDYRGQGISKMLLSVLLDQLKSCISVKLDATPAGQPVYNKFGFEYEYIIYRLTTSSLDNFQPYKSGIIPKQILLSDISGVTALDSSVFGTGREYLLKSLIKENPDKALMIKMNERITAFLLGRQGRKYQQIGPVSASSMEAAKVLISNTLLRLVGKPVVVDVPEDKKELILWLNSLGFISQRHFVRMYLQTNPCPGVRENQFLVCGPEFG